MTLINVHKGGSINLVGIVPNLPRGRGCPTWLACTAATPTVGWLASEPALVSEQVANERAAEKEALRVRLEATAARNDQLQESVSTLTRELADIRAQAKDARAQGESHRTALTQAKTEKIQVTAAAAMCKYFLLLQMSCCRASESRKDKRATKQLDLCLFGFAARCPLFLFSKPYVFLLPC